MFHLCIGCLKVDHPTFEVNSFQLIIVVLLDYGRAHISPRAFPLQRTSKLRYEAFCSGRRLPQSWAVAFVVDRHFELRRSKREFVR